MRWWVVLILTCCFGVAAAQPYSEQDRLSKSGTQVVEMGHDGWLAWFCDPSRAGADGNVQAERIYGWELGVQNHARIKLRSEADQKFFNDVAILFGTICKSAFTIEHARNGRWSGSSMLVAQASTYVNQAIQELLGKPKANMRLHFQTLYDSIEDGKSVGTRSVYDANPDYVKREYSGLATYVKLIEEKFKSRSRGEQEVAFRLSKYMVNIARRLEP